MTSPAAETHRARPSRPVNRFARFHRVAEPRPLPLVLQQRAQRAERVHVQRVVLRTVTLLAFDLVVLVGVRTLMHLFVMLDSGAAALRFRATAFVPGNVLSPVQVCVAILIGLAACGNYGEGDQRRDPGRLLAGVTIGLTVNWWHVLWASLSPTRIVGFAAMVVAVWGLMLVERFLLNLAVRRLCVRFGWGPRVLVLGSETSARHVLQLPVFRHRPEMRAIGWLDIGTETSPDALGSIDDFVAVMTDYDVDTVLICDDVDPDTARVLVDISDAARRQVVTVPAYFNAPGIEPSVIWRRGTAMVSITRPGTSGRQRVAKRVFDMAASAAALMALAPLFALISLAVRLTSRGGVFFRQERVGRGGRPFTIYKFRSMVCDAEARRGELVASSMYGDQRLFKMKNDPRITRVGAFLRRTSLDELPQLFNVLRGDMSLVGPRPPIPSEVALYAEHHYTRFDVRPGITGPWQAGGRNNITDFEDVIRLETAYIRHWTLWKDLTILLHTIPAVLRMEGAH